MLLFLRQVKKILINFLSCKLKKKKLWRTRKGGNSVNQILITFGFLKYLVKTGKHHDLPDFLGKSRTSNSNIKFSIKSQKDLISNNSY